MAKKSTEYGNESIYTLNGPDKVRKRPGVIFGSDGLDGCQHAFFEILSNSIDEAREGYGKTIWVTKYLDGSYEVEDNGRGVPVDFNEREQRYNWDLIYCELYAGGKYNNLDGGNYEFSLGLNGLGACATQCVSEYMTVVSRRDGWVYSLRFEKGYNVSPAPGFTKEPMTGKKTGTVQRFKPDYEIFTETDITVDHLRDVLHRQAAINAGITFILKNETASGKFSSEEFYYAEGISSYAAELAAEDAITPIQRFSTEKAGRDRDDKPEYRVKEDVAFCFTAARSAIEYYHNSSWLEYGGSPDKAAKSAFVSAIDGWLKDNNKYQKNEEKITFNDIADSLILVSSGFSTYTSYENQTKKAINNRFIQTMMTEFLRSSLDVYFIENRQDAEKIANQILINKRSREQSEKARLNIKKKLTGSIDVTNRVQKFVDCRSKDTDRRELYIVEGDSALGSVKQARDADFQAIMPVRGKILNCLKAEYSKIFKSEIITDLIKVFGCGVDIKARSKDLSAFDISALRWNKIIICTDADVDGYQIRTLILTMIWRLTPALIEKGYVYIAESPLFEITQKGKSYFAYTDSEKDQIVSKLDPKGISIMRSKGLGENDPEMMWQTTMNPQTRKLIKILPTDAEATARTFDILLGDNLAGRKDYIAAYGSKYLDLADVN